MVLRLSCPLLEGSRPCSSAVSNRSRFPNADSGLPRAGRIRVRYRDDAHMLRVRTIAIQMHTRDAAAADDGDIKGSHAAVIGEIGSRGFTGRDSPESRLRYRCLSLDLTVRLIHARFLQELPAGLKRRTDRRSRRTDDSIPLIGEEQ